MGRTASRSNDPQAEWSEPFGLIHVDEPFGYELRAERLMSSRSGSKTIGKIILIRIRYSICESKHLATGTV